MGGMHARNAEMEEWGATLKIPTFVSYEESAVSIFRHYLYIGCPDRRQKRGAVTDNSLKGSRWFNAIGVQLAPIWTVTSQRESYIFASRLNVCGSLIDDGSVKEVLKEWYSSYKIVRDKIYNPYCIANFFINMKIDPYWEHTISI